MGASEKRSRGLSVQSISCPGCKLILGNACEEVFARIPSYFLDEERACPATTYYQSAMLHGVCELVEQHEQKAHVLAILMQRFQPEGRYTPLSEPLYRKSIEKLAVFRVPTTNIVGKFKVGQNRPPLERQRVMQKLWERGQSGDILTICKMLRADHTLPTPSFLLAPERCVFELDPLSAGGMDDAVDWLRQTYWNQNISVETLRRVHLHSTWIMVRDNNGAFVATARATSDRGKSAWIYDVFVHPTWRGKGLGKALLRLLLDHPDVRMVRTVFLGTKDAQGFYKSLGFHEGMLQKAYESSTMWLRQNSTE